SYLACPVFEGRFAVCEGRLLARWGSLSVTTRVLAERRLRTRDSRGRSTPEAPGRVPMARALRRWGAERGLNPAAARRMEDEAYGAGRTAGSRHAFRKGDRQPLDPPQVCPRLHSSPGWSRGLHDTHDLISDRTGEVVSKANWEWAELDGRRLVWAA